MNHSLMMAQMPGMSGHGNMKMDMKRDIAKLQAATGKQIDRPVSGHDDRAPPAGLNSILIWSDRHIESCIINWKILLNTCDLAGRAKVVVVQV